MTIAHAKQFIRRGMQDVQLRDRLMVSSGWTALTDVLKKEGLIFSAHDFDEAFHNLLTQCQDEGQADQLREFKMWWHLTEALTLDSTA